MHEHRGDHCIIANAYRTCAHRCVILTDHNPLTSFLQRVQWVLKNFGILKARFKSSINLFRFYVFSITYDTINTIKSLSASVNLPAPNFCQHSMTFIAQCTLRVTWFVVSPCLPFSTVNCHEIKEGGTVFSCRAFVRCVQCMSLGRGLTPLHKIISCHSRQSKSNVMPVTLHQLKHRRLGVDFGAVFYARSVET